MDNIVINKPFSMEFRGPHILISTAPSWSNITIRNVPVSLLSSEAIEQTQIMVSNDAVCANECPEYDY